ncbi:unnamed protein product [Orchesella dallaii]|uniref:C2 DOCK-type domain-containing protein n=1 Tax=Orchesella dallaii TaxID=48710 RepID=A0ABP1PNW1_9HEXA
MSERKFARVKGKVGSAAQARETVSKHVRCKTIYQNKSLLVDCIPETEYSTKKLYVIRRLANESSEFDTSSSNSSNSSSGSDDIGDDLEENYNLFVKECLRTYSTPFLELANSHDDDEEDEDLRLIKQKLEARSSFLGRHRFHENGIIHSTSTLNVPSSSELASIISKPHHLSTSSSTSILNTDCHVDGNRNGVASRSSTIIYTVVDGDTSSICSTNGNGEPPLSPTKAPAWFWNVSYQSRGIELDEAGIALEGRLGVNYKEESFGDRYVQVKWDDGDEKFYFIAWSHEAGREFICKVDLGEADPIWYGDNKLVINEALTVHSEQRRGLLRDLYTVCVELGCYDKSASLAGPDNVLRARNLVYLFQRVDMDLSHELNGNHRSKPEPSSKTSTLSSSASVTMGNIVALAKNKLARSLTTLFTLRIESLEFRLKTETGSPVEPYYLSLALYDVKNGKKISEDFHATVSLDGTIVGNAGGQFRVSETNDQIYAVLRVEKTLQATDWETYLRANPDGKTGSRISKSITGSPLFTTEQRYRMPLCWSCRCLFKKSLNGTSEYVLDPETHFSPFYKHEKSAEEEILKILADMKKPEKASKLTAVPGAVKVVVESMKPEVMAVIETKENCSLPNVIEFPINSCDNFSKFVHLLYVYPISLNLNHVAGKIRARNILCRVFLRTEDDIEASPLEQHPTGGSIATYVLHHRSNPEWYTEIKLSLPVALDPRLHLLFQFFHISCSFDNKNKTKPVENIVGYSWIPLLNKYRFIGGEHVLPVANTLPSGYLQIQPLGLGRGYSGPEINWLDKCTLSVKLNLISTIWTKCGCLGAFFAHSEKYLHRNSHGHSIGKLHCDDETTMKTIRALETMDLATLRDFFPTIINQVCNVAAISRNVGTAALKFLIFAFHALIEAGFESIIEQKWNDK